MQRKLVRGVAYAACLALSVLLPASSHAAGGAGATPGAAAVPRASAVPRPAVKPAAPPATPAPALRAAPNVSPNNTNPLPGTFQTSPNGAATPCDPARQLCKNP
jgi:hypothetical protein